MSRPRTIACPQCGAAVEWSPASRWRPFCSERCKLIDFGGWASGSYRVPTAEAPDPDDLPGPREDDPSGS